MNREFLLMMMLPPALILGAIWLLPRALQPIQSGQWYSVITEEAGSLWEEIQGALPWEEYPQLGPVAGGDTYPEGTRWVTVPVELQGSAVWPAPMLPGTEDWWDINYPGWTYV